jgi:hypothetical protein
MGGTRTYYDNLDQVTKVERYHEQSPSADILASRQEAFYDDLGRTYETRRYAVNPTDGTIGSYVAGYTWYDAAGNVIKQQAEGERSFSKTFYDGLGRATKQFVGYDLSETPGCTISSSSSSSSSGEAESYTTATNVTGDTVMEQTESDFDDAGNAIFVTSRQRFHNATGTGELTTPSGSQPKARVKRRGHPLFAGGSWRPVRFAFDSGLAKKWTAMDRPCSIPDLNSRRPRRAKHDGMLCVEAPVPYAHAVRPAARG